MEGQRDKVEGKAQEYAGKVTGDDETEAEGKNKQMGGKAKEMVGKAKDKIDDLRK